MVPADSITSDILKPVGHANLPSVLYVGSDHAGFQLKTQLKVRFQQNFQNVEWVDLGTHNEASCDYPVFAEKVAHSVAGNTSSLGLLICGSGTGMAIAANKCRGVRAAVGWDASSSRLAREHNDVRILCLGERLMGQQTAWDSLQAWLTTEFQSGRHQKRIIQIEKIENSR